VGSIDPPGPGQVAEELRILCRVIVHFSILDRVTGISIFNIMPMSGMLDSLVMMSACGSVGSAQVSKIFYSLHSSMRVFDHQSFDLPFRLFVGANAKQQIHHSFLAHNIDSSQVK